MTEGLQKDTFAYREYYLETVLKRSEPNEKYETMLGELYI